MRVLALKDKLTPRGLIKVFAHTNLVGAVSTPNLVSRLTQITLAKDAASLCFLPLVSMQKTKKSVAKRFKLTAKGKLMRRTPGFRHLLATKSSKQKRRASQDKQVAAGHAAPLKRCLPFGL